MKHTPGPCLIAAAPELLEALKYLFEMLTAFDRPAPGEEFVEPLEIARKAIAKATGGAE